MHNPPTPNSSGSYDFGQKDCSSEFRYSEMTIISLLEDTWLQRLILCKTSATIGNSRYPNHQHYH